MITRCVHCGRYYSVPFGKPDPEYCGGEECKKKMENEKSFFAGDVRVPAPFPGTEQLKVEKPKRGKAKVK